MLLPTANCAYADQFDRKRERMSAAGLQERYGALCCVYGSPPRLPTVFPLSANCFRSIQYWTSLMPAVRLSFCVTRYSYSTKGCRLLVMKCSWKFGSGALTQSEEHTSELQSRG